MLYGRRQGRPTRRSVSSALPPSRAGVFNLGYAYPWGYVGSFQGVREHHCRICIILLETVGVDCMWSAEPIGDVHVTASAS